MLVSLYAHTHSVNAYIHTVYTHVYVCTCIRVCVCTFIFNAYTYWLYSIQQRITVNVSTSMLKRRSIYILLITRGTRKISFRFFKIFQPWSPWNVELEFSAFSAGVQYRTINGHACETWGSGAAASYTSATYSTLNGASNHCRNPYLETCLFKIHQDQFGKFEKTNNISPRSILGLSDRFVRRFDRLKTEAADTYKASTIWCFTTDPTLRRFSCLFHRDGPPSPAATGFPPGNTGSLISRCERTTTNAHSFGVIRARFQRGDWQFRLVAVWYGHHVSFLVP